MENAVKAIEMAFAVFVFVIALSITIFSFSNAKSASDVVLYAQDETNYYDYQGAKGKEAENRIVGLETIIPTLYNYNKENYTVIFRKANYSDGNFSNIEQLPVYTTKSNEKLWGTIKNGKNTYEELMENKYSTNIPGYLYKKDKNIFSFDLEEETLRHEPWVGKNEKINENLKYFLSGGIYKNPNNNKEYINYGDGFIKTYNDRKFVETISEYTYSSSQEQDTQDGSSISNLAKLKKNKKRIIIFTLIN